MQTLNIILTVHISTWMKQTFFTEQNKCGVKLLRKHSVVGQVLRNSFCSKTVLWSLWTTAVLYGCKCSRIVAFCGDDAGIHFAVHQCDRFSWRCFQFSKNFVQFFPKAYILHVLSCLTLNLLLETNSLMCKLFSCVLVCIQKFSSIFTEICACSILWSS